LPDLIQRYHLAFARAWLEHRGLDAPERNDICIYNTRVRADDVTGIPWNQTFNAIQAMKASYPGCIQYEGDWYREAWRVRLYQYQRKSLLEAIRACDRCCATVRLELNGGSR
jgi:hypothetical protein